MLTVIIPAYNEEKMIDISAKKINKVLGSDGIPCNLLYIDDGSTDNTWEEIKKASEVYDNVSGMHFSRNFGKEAAIMAGLTNADGDCVVVMDCDLQHPPETIISMYRLWEDGYEVVEGIKTSRGKESLIHRMFAKFFYAIISKLSGFDMESASDFKLLDRKVVDAFKDIKETNAFFRALSSWVGFKTTYVYFDVGERVEGTSKWSTFSLFKYAIRNITQFSSMPMQLVTIFGVISLIITVVLGCIALVQKITGVAVDGFTTVVLLILIFGSIIMISLGLIGYYISKIFDEVKRRPLYIVCEKCGSGARAVSEAQRIF